MVIGKVGSPIGRPSLRERMFFNRSHPVRSSIARLAGRLGIPAAAGLIADATVSAIIPDLEHMAPFISNIDSQLMARIIIGTAAAALVGIGSILVGRTPKQIIAQITPLAVGSPVAPQAPVVPAPVVPPPAGVVPPPAAARGPVTPPPSPRPLNMPPPPPAKPAAPAAPAASVRELFDKGQFTQAFDAADLANPEHKGVVDEILLRRQTFGRVLQEIEALKKTDKFAEAAARLEAIINAGLLVSHTEIEKIKLEIARLHSSDPRAGAKDLTMEIDVNMIDSIASAEAFEKTMLSMVPPPAAPVAPAPAPAIGPLPSAPTTVPPPPAGSASGSSSGSTTVGSQMDLFLQALKNDAVRQQLIAAGSNKKALKKILEDLPPSETVGIESLYDAAYELVAEAS